MVLVVRYPVLLEVVLSVESSSGPKGKGYGLTKREYLNKTQKRREVKDLFGKESFRENPSYGVASF